MAEKSGKSWQNRIITLKYIKYEYFPIIETGAASDAKIGQLQTDEKYQILIFSKSLFIYLQRFE